MGTTEQTESGITSSVAEGYDSSDEQTHSCYPGLRATVCRRFLVAARRWLSRAAISRPKSNSGLLIESKGNNGLISSIKDRTTGRSDSYRARYALRLLKAVTELLLGIIDSMYPLQCGIGYKMALSARFASALSNDCLREAWHTLRVQDVLSCRTNELISAVLKMLG